jgi:hypothetical protein
MTNMPRLRHRMVSIVAEGETNINLRTLEGSILLVGTSQAFTLPKQLPVISRNSSHLKSMRYSKIAK